MSNKGPGYMDASIVGCQFSVYPLRQMDIDAPVQGVIKAAAELGEGGQSEHPPLGR
jgi:hypothetical protein